jgi:tRNA pseudouridine13 synthase
MYIIKEKPEDFLVEEILVLPCCDGAYSYWQLRKKNLTTLEAVAKISGQLRIPLKYVKFAGNKDKRAVTTQHISVYSAPKERIASLSIQDIALSFVGHGAAPIYTGQHQGNRFQVTVRNLDTAKVPLLKVPLLRVTNYFGAQRFSEHNVDIGRSIVKKNFRAAAELIDHPSAEDYLERNPKDHIGALRTLPKSLMKLFLHSYQSFIWNKTASLYIQRCHPTDNLKVPIVGFGTEITQERMSLVVKQILDEERLTPRDFIVRQFPELSSEGGERDLFMEILDFSMGPYEPDELHDGKLKTTLNFTLPKGSYATVLVEHVFGSQDLNSVEP